MLRTALVALAFCFAVPTQAQEADPADVASIDAVMATIYEILSGPADQDRDWGRFRSLHHPDARVGPTTQNEDGSWSINVSALNDFIEMAGDYYRNTPAFQGKGFYEIEAARRTERFGNIAHVWSTYESRLDPAEEPFARGINSLQLVHDGERWWVLNVVWQEEGPDTPIPTPYLPSDG